MGNFPNRLTLNINNKTLKSHKFIKQVDLRLISIVNCQENRKNSEFEQGFSLTEHR